VVMNTSPEAAVGEVIGLVLDAAEQVESDS
jgi:hypothetical protein